MPWQKNQLKISSTLASLFSVVLNCKILLFLLLKTNDQKIIIIRHLVAELALALG
jgi:hypothetical protein